jgi:hypothetical protein
LEWGLVIRIHRHHLESETREPRENSQINVGNGSDVNAQIGRVGNRGRDVLLRLRSKTNSAVVWWSLEVMYRLRKHRNRLDGVGIYWHVLSYGWLHGKHSAITWDHRWWRWWDLSHALLELIVDHVIWERISMSLSLSLASIFCLLDAVRDLDHQIGVRYVRVVTADFPHGFISCLLDLLLVPVLDIVV